MWQSDMNPTGYTSCIKIFGVPILPPLITEERRKILNEEKQKAIEIEKKLKGKRNSIDSGVMTGSYIESFKNNEMQQNEESCPSQPSTHDVTLKANVEDDSTLSYDVVNLVSDSFLKTALEDPEFREFFSATAEKIFKDNNIDDSIKSAGEIDSDSYQENKVGSKEDDIQSLKVLSSSSVFEKPLESLDFSFSDNLSQVTSVVESDILLKSSGRTRTLGNRPSEREIEKEHSSPPPSRIRRNSYTLESPSPVLLEHLAKEIAGGDAKKWQTLSDEKDEDKGPGFKTFPGKSQRKHWDKKKSNRSSCFEIGNHCSMFTLRRSNTFVKPEKKVIKSNYSLPCSTQTSPLQLCPFTRSVDCIKTIEVNTHYVSNKGHKCDFSINHESVNTSQDPQMVLKNTLSCVSSAETFVVQKHGEVQSVSSETSPTSMINNASHSVHSTCSIGTENFSPPQIEFSDSASQMSVATQSTYLHSSLNCDRNTNNDNVPRDISHSEDLDDIVSLCSTMSISKFLPTNDTANSRPSTAEEVSEANIRLLKMKHENELRELLEKQRKEEELYSQLLSSSGSMASRTTTNLSIGDPFDSNSEVFFIDKKESCSRELFPSQLSSNGNLTKQREGYSEEERKAATKLTAYVKGYLTRRLLKTEKVQQLIELIKESLTCAFTLQYEPHLKPTDLELHARLANQLNTALKELQSIVFAPAATRMAIIAADRERLRRPTSRPSSAISLATRKSILRRQQSLNSAEKKSHHSRTRTKSFSANGNSGSVCSGGSRVRSDSASTRSTSSSRLPWR